MTALPSAHRRRKPAHAPTSQFAVAILDTLESVYPEADTALSYRSPYELVVATILSAQCTDERVNMVTPVLFRRYPTPVELASARHEDVEGIIKSTGFFRAKARSIIGCAQALMADHGGTVPARMDALVKLPGVGRKTANVVLGHAFGIAEGIAVDTHVIRVSNRLGLAHSDDPIEIEKQLMALVPKDRWTKTTDLLIQHGRKICDARRPRCGTCPLFGLCRWVNRQAYAHTGHAPAKTRPKGRGTRIKR
jgi:endonuclease III